MAYNLQPFITILEQILDPQRTCWNIHDDSKLQLKSLLEKAISLQQILEKSPSLPNIEISLERQIRDAAHKAEDIIESRMVDGMLSNASMTEESMVKLVETTSGGGIIISSRGSSSGGGGASILEKAISLQQIESRMVDGMMLSSKASLTEESMVKLVETTSGGGIIISSRGSSSSGGGGASILEKAISLQQIESRMVDGMMLSSKASLTEESMVKLVETTRNSSSSGGGGGASIQSQSLLEKAISLQQILEKHPLPNIEISLESEIRDAAHIAQVIIESRMVPQIPSRNLIQSWLITWCKRFTFSSPGLQQLDSAMELVLKLVEVEERKIISSRGECITFSSADLQQVMLELDSAMEQVVKLVEVEAGNKMMISSRGPSSSSVGGGTSLNPKSASGSIHVVGFDEDLLELKDRLTNMQRKLEIIPIVGMGGAGKTTLARNLYEDPLIVYRFVARAWTTVSQDYDRQTILSSLLSCLIGKDQLDELIKKQVTVDELKDILYKSLYGRRYMIVLDDVWSTKVWDAMRRYFPDNNNGSRIVITTRESNVARYANSQSQQHEVKLLSESASWDLLCQIVFGEDDCPFVLESMGRKMASDCGGLPLAITVIGGLLSKVERSEDVWENIRKNVSGAIAKSEEGEQYSNIMSLSYKHLPNYLKPCFLYMAAFPEDYEIKCSRLVCLWIAEGFVKSNGSNKSLEEEAEDYLKGLVERNLVMVRSYKSNRKAKSYIIHDVLRDLCIKKADEDNFLHVIKNENDFGVSKLRRVSCEDLDGLLEEMDASRELKSLARSFLCTQNRLHELVRFICSISNLLRVLDIRHMMWFNEFPKEIFELVNLRYLVVKCKELPVGISRLVNLQTLIANLCVPNVPSEIWTMSELRHLKLSGIYLILVDFSKKHVQLNKLQTISRYLDLSESLLESGFLESIPNIKYLGISWISESEIDLSHLHKLETLRYKNLYRSNISCRFPPSLRKLTLWECVINGRMMLTVCGLPNLEVLKIKGCRFEVDSTGAEEWEARQGEEFRSLQFLLLDYLNLVRWRADETNFPKLRHLLLQDCPRLEEIPSNIGDIPTLELIQMERCSASAVESAKQILEVQQSDYGNYALQLRIND